MMHEPHPTNEPDAGKPHDACERATQLSVELLYGEAEHGAHVALEQHLARCTRCAAAHAARSAAHLALSSAPAPLVLAASATSAGPSAAQPMAGRSRARRRAWRRVAAALLVIGLGGALHALESARRAELADAQRRELTALAEQVQRAFLQRDELWRETLDVARQSHAALLRAELEALAAAQGETLARLRLEHLAEHARLRDALAELAVFAGYGRSGD